MSSHEEIYFLCLKVLSVMSQLTTKKAKLERISFRLQLNVLHMNDKCFVR